MIVISIFLLNQVCQERLTCRAWGAFVDFISHLTTKCKRRSSGCALLEGILSCLSKEQTGSRFCGKIIRTYSRFYCLMLSRCVFEYFPCLDRGKLCKQNTIRMTSGKRKMSAVPRIQATTIKYRTYFVCAAQLLVPEMRLRMHPPCLSPFAAQTPSIAAGFSASIETK